MKTERKEQGRWREWNKGGERGGRRAMAGSGSGVEEKEMRTER